MGFAHEYTYQDCKYRIRTMMACKAHVLYICEVTSLAQSCTQDYLKYVCDQVGQAMLTSF